MLQAGPEESYDRLAFDQRHLHNKFLEKRQFATFNSDVLTVSALPGTAAFILPEPVKALRNSAPKLDRLERNTGLYLYILAPLAAAAFVWALDSFPLNEIDAGAIAIGLVTIFLSSYLRVQLPGTKIHLTFSDALIFLAFLVYGGHFALILATLETAFASWNLKRRGVPMRLKTIAINVSVASISVFAAVAAVSIIFGRLQEPFGSLSADGYIWPLICIGSAHFCVNSMGISGLLALRSQSALWTVWKGYCVNSVALYVCGVAVAGISLKAFDHFGMIIFAAAVALVAIVLTTCQRYADGMRHTAAKAEAAERERAEQAEEHLKQLQHYVGELEKSSEALRTSREKFRHAAYHDALTGLPNRNYFIDKLKDLLHTTADGTGCKFAVLFLDLNRFKTINDSLGHSFGDAVIKQIAERLVGIVPKGDLVGRFSGDEFAIILHQISSTDEVVRLAERISLRVAEPLMLNGRCIFASVSIGIAFDCSKYAEPEEILRDADIAMYYAKENQRSYVIFDQKMHLQAVTLLELETDLRYAIERDELELYYQPIVRLDDATISGVEALVRWNHPSRGLISPDDFIALSEDTGLIVPMTIQIMYKACTQLVAWQQQCKAARSLTVSINISAKHFAEGDLVGQIKTVLAETRINPANLKLEITESALMGNAEHAASNLRQIRKLGVTISIDDFGTGYSSLSYLHRFPIDVLKIDRSFVSTMEDGSDNGEIVRTVLALASTLKLSVIAEGIESIHQLHQLRILGCEFGQGFLFSRPLRATEIEKLLADKGRWQSIASNPLGGFQPPAADYAQLPFAG